MSDETLHTASRRVVRFMRIDTEGGCFVTQATQGALDTLERELENDKRPTILRGYARAALTLINGDLKRGGFIGEKTLWALDQLDREVRHVDKLLSGAIDA